MFPVRVKAPIGMITATIECTIGILYKCISINSLSNTNTNP